MQQGDFIDPSASAYQAVRGKDVELRVLYVVCVRAELAEDFVRPMEISTCGVHLGAKVALLYLGYVVS